MANDENAYLLLSGPPRGFPHIAARIHATAAQRQQDDLAAKGA
jgi:hypothetical protein